MVKDCPHILVIDDDTRLRSLLQRYLQENGFAVSGAKDAENARMFLQQYQFNLLIVDVMMPGESGIEFLQKLRRDNNVPAIVLTAMGDTADRIAGLEAGADDYLPKPFEPKELVLRINNILRRVPADNAQAKQLLNIGAFSYDLEKKELVDGNGEIVHITPVEQSILNILGAKSGQIFTRERLAELLGAGQNSRSIDVQITRLRKKNRNRFKKSALSADGARQRLYVVNRIGENYASQISKKSRKFFSRSAPQIAAEKPVFPHHAANFYTAYCGAGGVNLCVFGRQLDQGWQKAVR